MSREPIDPRVEDVDTLSPDAPPPNAPTDQPPAGDARHDEQKRKQNREHLRVNEDHKTPEMEKGHRGTFP